jgi:Uma2 family endonuclease
MATSIPVVVPRDPEDYLYPESDGKPLGETGFHVTAILTLFDTLRLYYQDRPDVYVATDMFLYYERGNPRACKAPDVMVIKGVAGNHLRRTFKTWVEGAVPSAIFEITSDETINEDSGGKRTTYASLGVAEYFLFDPVAAILRPPLQGFRLKKHRYVPIRPAKDGSLLSEQLGMRLLAERPILRLVEAGTGIRLFSGFEQAIEALRQADQEKRRADEQEQRADAMAAEVARLKAELARAKRRKK